MEGNYGGGRTENTEDGISANSRWSEQTVNLSHQVIVVFVKKVMGVKESDVARGGRGAHVQARLLHRRRAVERAREGADGASDHQELLDLGVGESVEAAAALCLILGTAAVTIVRFRRLDL